MNNVRIRVNLSQREFEVEGPEAFVQSYATQFASFIAKIAEESASPSTLAVDSSVVPTVVSATPIAPQTSDTLTSFGELYQFVPKTATDCGSRSCGWLLRSED